MDEKELGAIRSGEKARMILEFIEPDLEEKEKLIIDDMKGLFRSGDMDAVKLFSRVAALVALDNLRGTYKSRIAKGNRKRKETENDNQ